MDMSVNQLYETLKARKDCKSFLKKHLTLEIFEKLKDKKTKYGGTFADVIRAGAIALPTGTGVRVCDADAYTVFSELLVPIILDYHNLPTLKHRQPLVEDLHSIPFSNLDDEYVLSIRVRTARCLDGYPMYPTITSKERAAVEKEITAAFSTLDGDLEGTYFPLSRHEERNGLINDPYLFSRNESMEKTDVYKDWPNNRGIFFNDSKTVVASVNVEDHLRIISVARNSNLREVYVRLVKVLESLEKKLTFLKKEDLGYLNTSPSNLGTAIRASVQVQIPKLSQRKEFQDFLAKLDLYAQGVGKENVGGVYDICYKRRLGLTEHEVIADMQHRIENVIAYEKELEN